jgi:hypothetical protein
MTQSSPDSHAGRSGHVLSCTGDRTKAAAVMGHVWDRQEEAEDRPVLAAFLALRRLAWSLTAAMPHDARLDARLTRLTLLASLALVFTDHTEPTGEALVAASQGPRGCRRPSPDAVEPAQEEDATLTASQSGSLSLPGLQGRASPAPTGPAVGRWAVNSWGRGLKKLPALAWGRRPAEGASGTGLLLRDPALPTLHTLRGPVDTEPATLAARRAAMTISGDAGLKGRRVGEQGGAGLGTGLGAGEAPRAATMAGGSGAFRTTMYRPTGPQPWAPPLAQGFLGDGMTYSMRATVLSRDLKGMGWGSTTTVSMVVLVGGCRFESAGGDETDGGGGETDAPGYYLPLWKTDAADLQLRTCSPLHHALCM